MQFTFKNLGSIDSGEVTLGDLTVMYGPNNVGKTYINYTIYGLLREIGELMVVTLPSTSTLPKRLLCAGVLEINLLDYQDEVPAMLRQASVRFTAGLDTYFSAPVGFFKNANAELQLSNPTGNFERDFHRRTHFMLSRGNGPARRIGQVQVECRRDAGSSFLELTSKSLAERKVPNRTTLNRLIGKPVGQAVAHAFVEDVLPRPFVVTSERTGAALFYKELDIAKSKLSWAEGVLEKSSNILRSARSKYAKPTLDSINVVGDYLDIGKQKSFLRQEAQHKGILTMLKDIVGGNYEYTEQGVFYKPRKEKNRDAVTVPLYVASSSAKSLFLIDMYINHLAEPNGILIIDEPELNLHPINQRKMAGLLAMLVNAGVKVLIATHSDYLIGELNNRIKLHENDFDDRKKIMSDENIKVQELLPRTRVKAYGLLGDHKVHAAEVDNLGINAELFDRTIGETNRLANKLSRSMNATNETEG